jgi:hypothetical protein
VLELCGALAIHRDGSPVVVPGFVLPAAALINKIIIMVCKRLSKASEYDSRGIRTWLIIGSIVNVCPARMMPMALFLA